MDYTSLFQIASLDAPHLCDAPWTPLPPAGLELHNDIFVTIVAGNLLVHHPDDSFDDSVERFISVAADGCPHRPGHTHVPAAGLSVSIGGREITALNLLNTAQALLKFLTSPAVVPAIRKKGMQPG